MTTVKTYVRDDDTATLICPACKTVKHITAGKFRQGKHSIKVNCICQQEGFFENAKKRSIMRRGGRQSVTGLTVNQKVTLARDDRRRFKAILNNCKRHGLESQARGRENFRGWLEGYAAFAHMVQPELGAKWLAEIAKL